ncbi:hypothetical protein LEP1GSC116_0618, partial [Leptospira interrogans serovar Icterohaemorrhagiae str. Verdun HP]
FANFFNISKIFGSYGFFSGNSILENLPSASALLNQNINLIQEALDFPDRFPYWKLVPNYVRGTYVDDRSTI